MPHRFLRSIRPASTKVTRRSRRAPPENEASVALHLAAGFTIVGRRERLARQHGRWSDVLLLERRSPIIE